MKKEIILSVALMIGTCACAQSIERITDFEGGKVVITSSEKLFSGCQMRLCTYEDSTKVKVYGIELDLTDRTSHVREGSVFNIYFKDGSKITLSNLWDTQAEVTQESSVETRHHTYTDIIPVYDAWDDALYGVPVSVNYAEHVPVTRTTTFTSLYYIVTPEQLDKIEEGGIKEISVVTDEETIVKKARPLSDAVALLRTVLK